MATINRTDRAVNRNRVAMIVLGVLAVAGVVMVVLSLRSPPQMGPAEDVFHTVDALFTAVTSRDEARLRECEQRLRSYRDAGKLPAVAAEDLDAMIRQARSGRWESAAQSLYDFMRGQRREGSGEPIKHKKEKARPPAGKK